MSSLSRGENPAPLLESPRLSFWAGFALLPLQNLSAEPRSHVLVEAGVWRQGWCPSGLLDFGIFEPSASFWWPRGAPSCSGAEVWVPAAPFSWLMPGAYRNRRWRRAAPLRLGSPTPPWCGAARFPIRERKPQSETPKRHHRRVQELSCPGGEQGWVTPKLQLLRPHPSPFVSIHPLSSPSIPLSSPSIPPHPFLPFPPHSSPFLPLPPLSSPSPQPKLPRLALLWDPALLLLPPRHGFDLTASCFPSGLGAQDPSP